MFRPIKNLSPIDYLLLLKHRHDDYYNEDSEKKNIAEVIMAKHRGGSTGTVELLWMGNYTKFANIEKYRE